MYTPAILFAFSGIVVGLGTLFTTEAIFGEMATAGHLWFDCWNVLLQGGWTLFNQMPLLFCVALPISLANKQNARCCMEALAIYLTFNYFVSTILGQWWSGKDKLDFLLRILKRIAARIPLETCSPGWNACAPYCNRALCT